MTHMSRLRFLIIPLAVIFAVSGCSAQHVGSVIGLTYIPNIQFAPFYNADASGWYTEDSGVSLRHHGSAEGLFTALTTGEEQFVVAGGDEILQARSEGIDVVAVASYYRQYPARIIVPEDSDIHTMTDLAGHSVGVPGKFGESWFALLVGLAQAGLAQSDITVVEIGYTPQASLASGQVDAVVGFSNSDLIIFTASGIAVRSIDPKVPLVSICLATTSVYAAEHPDVVSLVISGMEKGMTTAIDDHQTTFTNAAKYIPSFRDEVRAQAEQVLPATTALFVDGAGNLSANLDPTQWDAMASALEHAGLVPASTDATTAFTNAYILG